MATSDVNASGSSDTTALSSPYGVGSYSGAPTSITSPAVTSTPAAATDPNAAPATTTASTAAPASSSSSLDWGSILSGLGGILGSPTVSSAAMIGLGEYEASQAQSQTAALTGQLTGPAQPFVQGGVSELQQTQQGLTGQPVTSGSIGQQELAAQEQGQAAVDYSTGKLTPAQQAQVQQQVQSQQQNIRQQLATQGVTDSSVIAGYDQQIQDNAAQLTQQLTQQNLTMGQQALASVQTTYSNLLNQSISQFGAGMGPIEDAVNLTVQSNTAIANGLQSLFGQIARGFSGASGTTAGGTSSLTTGLNGVLGAIGKLFGGSTSTPVPGSAGATGNLGDSPIGAPNIDTGTPGSGLDFSTGSIDLTGGDGDTSDLDSLLSELGFSGAGGQAAAVPGSAAATGNLGSNPIGEPNLPQQDLGDLSTYNNIDLSGGSSSSLGSALGTAGTVAGIVGGLSSHTATGEAGAALSAAQLANKYGVLGTPSSSLGAGLGGAAGALGLYSGIQQGGVVGGATAASGALRLGSGAASLAGDSGLAAGLGEAAGAVAIPLAAYNEIENWQSGATGSDALGGLETGATVGSVFGPLGTLIGGAIGGAVGALSSLFGGGKTDPETLAYKDVVSQYGAAYKQDPQAAQQTLSQMSPAQSFEMLAGAFDAKNNSAGHSQPIEQAFGRMQEGEFLNQMADEVNSAVTSGAISASTPPSQVYSQVVEPWIKSKTGGQGLLGGDNGEAGVLQGSIQNLIGAYMSGQLTSQSRIGISGQMDTSLPTFA